MTDDAQNAQRYHEMVTAVSAVATRRDPNLSPAGHAQRQRDGLAAWRAKVGQIYIPVPPVPDRATVLDPLRPRTADDVAILANERRKIDALRRAGRTDAEIIAAAGRDGLAALLDDVDTTDDVLSSSQGPQIAAERRDAIFARLTEIDPKARKVADAEAAAAPARAWHAIFADVKQYGTATVASKQALHRVNPAAYDLVAAAEREIDHAAIERLLRSQD